MPKFPDITLYIDALRERLQQSVLEEVQVDSPFLLRTVEPPLALLNG